MYAQRLDPEDLARLGMDTPNNPMVVTAVVRLDGPLAWERLLGLVETRILVHARMRARVVRSGLIHRVPSWQEETTSARDHVTPITRAPSASSEVDLAYLVSDLMSRPLDSSGSPWHLWLASGPDASTLVLRVHHVLADGLSLLRLLFGFSDEGAAMGEPDLSQASSETGGAHGSRAAALGRLVLRPPDPPSLLSGPLSGRKRVAWTAPIDVASLRDAAHAAAAHINDVFLAVLAGVLSDIALPGHADVLHALVPVALRHDGQRLGNHFVSLFVPLPMRAASPAARVRAARDAMKAARDRAGVPLGKALVAGATLLGRHVERLAVGVLSRKASLVATNLAGPPTRLHLGGRVITDLTFAAPAPGSIALSANAFSYGGKLRVTIASDTGVIPDPHRIARFFDGHARNTMADLLDRAAARR